MLIDILDIMQIFVIPIKAYLRQIRARSFDESIDYTLTSKCQLDRLQSECISQNFVWNAAAEPGVTVVPQHDHIREI